MATTRCTTLTTTMWVIYRVHGDATNRWSYASPALGTGFAELAQVVLAVADFTDSGATIDMNLSHFTGT
jgi:hypothetical protein